jgi:hypothetical protein
MTATITTQQEWFSNYVSATMSVLGVHAPDADGDLPVQGSTSRGWVRIQTDEPWGVRVFACAAYGVPAKVAVLKEINAVNLAVRGARVVLDKDGYVWVEYLLFADAVNTDNLRAVIRHVLEIADDVGLMLATVHGGSTPISPATLPSDG